MQHGHINLHHITTLWQLKESTAESVRRSTSTLSLHWLVGSIDPSIDSSEAILVFGRRHRVRFCASVGWLTEHKQPGKGGRPKGSDASKTHDAIVAAARRNFALHGYVLTQNRQIAADAGVTTSTLYHYFRNKLDIYVTVFRYADRMLAGRYRAAMEGATDADAGMRAVLSEAMRVYDEDSSVPLFLASVPVEMRHNKDIFEAITACPIETLKLLQGACGKNGAPLHASAISIRFFFAVTVGAVLYARPEIHGDYASMIRGFAKLLDGIRTP